MTGPVLLAWCGPGIGDLAVAVPALRGLRRAYPGYDLVLAAPAALTPLAAATGAVDRVHAVPPGARTEFAWRGPRPEVAVDLHGPGRCGHRALLATAPVRLIGYGYPPRPPALLDRAPAWRDDEHVVDRWCRLVRWYGVDAEPADRALAAPAPVPGAAGAVLLHPGAGDPDRRWPVARYAAVARRLVADGHRVLVTGSPAEIADGYLVAAAAGLPRSAVLAGRTDVGALAALAAHARLVVAGDTGVGQLATAYGTRSVLLFGPSRPECSGPPAGAGRHTVLWRGPRGLVDLGVDEVYAAAAAQLTAGHRAAASVVAGRSPLARRAGRGRFRTLASTERLRAGSAV